MIRNGRLFRETCEHDIGTHGRFAARFVTATGLAIFHRAMETGGCLCQAGRAVVPGFCGHLKGRFGKVRAGKENEAHSRITASFARITASLTRYATFGRVTTTFGRVAASFGRVAASFGRVAALATRYAALVGRG